MNRENRDTVAVTVACALIVPLAVHHWMIAVLHGIAVWGAYTLGREFASDEDNGGASA